jgi:mevalonate pyrophosphate decarboxylase
MPTISGRRRLAAAVAAAAVAVVAGGCAAGRTAPATAAARNASGTPAAGRSAASPSAAFGAAPSESAKMICEPEAADEIAAALGVRASQPPSATWADQVYSCRYTYAVGTMVLSIKELSDEADTTAYYTAAQNSLPSHTAILVLGQNGFVGPDGTTYVRKDFKVLRVDVSMLPDPFGKPPASHSDAAFLVAAVIMSCWTGG